MSRTIGRTGSRPSAPRPAAPAVAAAVAVATCLTTACGPGAKPRPYPEPRAEELLAHLAALDDRVTSFRADSTMDYWLGSNRVKGTVLLLGAWGARLRFNAENPTGGTVAADMACDGEMYRFIDYNNNCQLVGPCDEAAIAAFFRVTLAPDDFIAMAVGGTPVLEGATAKTTWDAKRGVERLELSAGSRTQIVELDGRERRWDVLQSTLYDGEDVVWKLENKDFVALDGPADSDDDENSTSPGDASVRVPKRTRFVQPGQEADLVIRWNERDANIETNPAMFTFDIPGGLPVCQ